MAGRIRCCRSTDFPTDEVSGQCDTDGSPNTRRAANTHTDGRRDDASVDGRGVLRVDDHIVECRKHAGLRVRFGYGVDEVGGIGTCTTDGNSSRSADSNRQRCGRCEDLNRRVFNGPNRDVAGSRGDSLVCVDNVRLRLISDVVASNGGSNGNRYSSCSAQCRRNRSRSGECTDDRNVRCQSRHIGRRNPCRAVTADERRRVHVDAVFDIHTGTCKADSRSTTDSNRHRTGKHNSANFLTGHGLQHQISTGSDGCVRG